MAQHGRDPVNAPQGPERGRGIADGGWLKTPGASPSQDGQEQYHHEGQGSLPQEGAGEEPGPAEKTNFAVQESAAKTCVMQGVGKAIDIRFRKHLMPPG